MNLSSTFIPTQRIHGLLCELLADYRAGTDNRAVLKDLRAELGEAEYKNFERDLVRAMDRMSAAGAVKKIISQAVRRSKERPKEAAEFRQPISKRFD